MDYGTMKKIATDYVRSRYKCDEEEQIIRRLRYIERHGYVFFSFEFTAIGDRCRCNKYCMGHIYDGRMICGVENVPNDRNW